jgi:hypothetical protein
MMFNNRRKPMGSEMLIMSLGLKAKDRFRVDEEWARSALADARRAIDAMDAAQLKKITGERGKSRKAIHNYKQGLIAALDDVESAAFGNHRQAAIIEGGGGIVLLLAGGMSWGDPPTELFDSMARVLEADVIPDARWPGDRHPPQTHTTTSIEGK